MEVLSTHDGYTLEARATAILEGLGIPIASHQQKLSTLSGGFKLRVLLAQVLIGGPDCLLLDEPTNHLDILSIRWLEKSWPPIAAPRWSSRTISASSTTSRPTSWTWITARSPATSVTTRASWSKKAAVRERKELEIGRQQKIIAEKRAFVERFGAKASKAKQAQSRMKQIEKIEVEELAQSSRREPLFRFVQERPSGKEVLELEGISKAYGSKVVLKDVSLTVRRGEKLAVIGANGLGKSTLLKIIMERLKADLGKIRLGHEVRLGYFAQDHHELLGSDKQTPLEYIWDAVAFGGHGHRARHARPCAVQRRRRDEADRLALRW